jgi:photosystem II stability/assembly factor-like uncharacterized protein
MKTFLSVVCAFLVAALSVTGCDAPASDWKIVGECDIPMGDKSNFVGFLNDSYALSVGFGGGIKTSCDGGKTWIKAQNQSQCRLSLDIVDDNLSWTGGNGSNVRVTKDGGKTWEAVTDCRLGSAHMSIDFLDDKTGWLASTKRIAATDDGGATWTELSAPKGMDDIATVAIRSANEGYILTKSGILYATSDRGSNWNSLSVNLSKYRIGGDKLMAADMNFYDGKRGEIVFSGNRKNGARVWILSTDDGGATWISKSLPYPEKSTATEIYFASSGEYVTVTSMNKRVTVFKKG